jgi:hypothetical protein
MEAAQRPGNADECGGDIAAPGRAKTRKPAARIAVKGHAHHRTDDEDDDEVDKGGAAVGSIRFLRTVFTRLWRIGRDQ